MKSEPASVEYWDENTLDRESKAFLESNRNLFGLSESELLERFGKPDEMTSGMYQEEKDGWIKFQGDKDFRYLSLLPHCVVCFTILGGIVERLYFFPKLKN